MISGHKITKEHVGNFTTAVEVSEIDIGNSKFGFGIIMAMAGFVGVWGCICLMNGLSQSQSIQELGRSLFTAFTGI